MGGADATTSPQGPSGSACPSGVSPPTVPLSSMSAALASDSFLLNASRSDADLAALIDVKPHMVAWPDARLTDFATCMVCQTEAGRRLSPRCL